MKQPSVKELEQYLNGYSGHAKNWEPDDADTFLTCSAREVLENNLHRLNEKQLQQLKEADQRFILLLKSATEETNEVGDLRRLVDGVIGKTEYQLAA